MISDIPTSIINDVPTEVSGVDLHHKMTNENSDYRPGIIKIYTPEEIAEFIQARKD